jgi:hypothetical protein
MVTLIKGESERLSCLLRLLAELHLPTPTFSIQHARAPEMQMKDFAG